MNLAAIGLLAFLATLGWLIVRFGLRPSADQKPAAVLGPIGTRASAVLAKVGEPAMLGRYGRGPSFYSVPVSLSLADESGSIETHLTCEERHLTLLQRGAPCELLIDPAEHTQLMVASVQNAFGVQVATEIGSSHFPW